MIIAKVGLVGDEAVSGVSYEMFGGMMPIEVGLVREKSGWEVYVLRGSMG